MTIKLGTPKPAELKPRITVIGVGGAGGNAVNNMIGANLEGVEFLACNTDAQALSLSVAGACVQLGSALTQGLGSGSKPEVGRSAAQEAQDEIMDHIQGCHMAFVTAGMGGGTGTGAAPVIAQFAREAGVLTVGVVTKPFTFEGAHRMAIAEAGISELQNYVDTLLVIPNQNLFRVANERTTFADAFKMADDVLHAGVRGVTDLMVMPGLINLDFADVKAVMEEMGKAMMGTGESEGDKRALEAAEAAISNPLLEDTSMQGARGMLINITGGADMTLFEVDEAVNRIKDEVDDNANIIFGSTFDERLDGKMRVSIVATGIDVAADSVRPPRLQVVSATGPEAPSFVEAAATSGGGGGGGESYLGIPQHGIDRDRSEAPAHMDVPGPTMTLRQPESSARAEAPQPEPRAPAAPPERSVPQTALRTVASPRPAEEPFIAPPPVEPHVSRASSPVIPPDPFAEAAVTNGAAPRRPGPSLLERMTGLGRRPRPEAGDRAKEDAARPEEAPSRLRQDRPEEAEEPKPAIAAPGPRLQAPELKAESGERMAASPSAADDLLEIPAFLRRQAN